MTCNSRVTVNHDETCHHNMSGHILAPVFQRALHLNWQPTQVWMPQALSHNPTQSRGFMSLPIYIFFLEFQTRLHKSPGLYFIIVDWTCHHQTHLCQIYILNWNVLQGSSKLCNWLSLQCLVPWNNHLPPLCWSTFQKLVLDGSWFLFLT